MNVEFIEKTGGVPLGFKSTSPPMPTEGKYAPVLMKYGDEIWIVWEAHGDNSFDGLPLSRNHSATSVVGTNRDKLELFTGSVTVRLSNLAVNTYTDEQIFPQGFNGYVISIVSVISYPKTPGDPIIFTTDIKNFETDNPVVSARQNLCFCTKKGNILAWIPPNGISFNDGDGKTGMVTAYPTESQTFDESVVGLDCIVKIKKKE